MRCQTSEGRSVKMTIVRVESTGPGFTTNFCRLPPTTLVLYPR